MTEEIIIDGVNVAGCDYYYRCDCKIDDDTDINLCKWHDDCYYKQLKRLEQERDELKKTVENQKLEYEELQCDLSEVENACGCYQSENAELKQENKELKDINNHLQAIIDDGRAENKRFREENKELKAEMLEMTNRNQLTLFDIDNEPIKVVCKSKYQQWKYENNYRKADNDDKRCKNCKNRFITHSGQKVYYKCILLGMSSSPATDIRLRNVCNLFTPENADCQLCKHLDCDTEGHFICGLDNDILDHSGIYCNRFEEYIEERENADTEHL